MAARLLVAAAPTKRIKIISFPFNFASSSTPHPWGPGVFDPGSGQEGRAGWAALGRRPPAGPSRNSSSAGKPWGGRKGSSPHSGATNSPGGRRGALRVPARPAHPPRSRDRVSRSLLCDRQPRADAFALWVHARHTSHTCAHTQRRLLPSPGLALHPGPPETRQAEKEAAVCWAVSILGWGGGNGIDPEAAPGQVLGHLEVGARRGCVRRAGAKEDPAVPQGTEGLQPRGGTGFPDSGPLVSDRNRA